MDRDQVKIITPRSEKEMEVVNSVGGVLTILVPGTLEPAIYVTPESKQHPAYFLSLERGYVYYELEAHKKVETRTPDLYNILKETSSLEEYAEKAWLYINSLDREAFTKYLYVAYGPDKTREEIEIDKIAASRSDAYSVSSLLNLLETRYHNFPTDDGGLGGKLFELQYLRDRIENLKVISSNMWREYFLTKNGGDVSATPP